MTVENKLIVKGIFTNIKGIRRGNKLTQHEVALSLNLSVFSYSRIENGLVDIKFSRLEQIAAVFEMSVMQLINWNNSYECEAVAVDLSAQTELYEVEIESLRRRIISLNEELYHINSDKSTI
jgi:transcriptional regulator with XRE-family HTH domain